MRWKRGGISGNSKLARLLNKPIKGKLAEKRSSLFVFLTLFAALAVIFAYAVYVVGVEGGLAIMTLIVLLGVASFFESKRRTKQAKKYKWKVFGDESSER